MWNSTLQNPYKILILEQGASQVKDLRNFHYHGAHFSKDEKGYYTLGM